MITKAGNKMHEDGRILVLDILEILQERTDQSNRMKQKELIDYYVNFDKAGKMLTTGDMSLLDLNLKGGSKHD